MFARLKLLLLLLILVSAHSKAQVNAETEARAQAAAREWILNKTLELPETYISDEFEPVEEIIDLSQAADSARVEWLDVNRESLKNVIKDSAALTDSIRLKVQLAKDQFDSFEKEHIGYKVVHRFTAESADGQTYFYEAEFKMDKSFKIYESSVIERIKSDKKAG